MDADRFRSAAGNGALFDPPHGLPDDYGQVVEVEDGEPVKVVSACSLFNLLRPYG